MIFFPLVSILPFQLSHISESIPVDEVFLSLMVRHIICSRSSSVV